MSFYEHTLDELVERLCRLVLDEWYGGTTTSAGTTTTAVDNKRAEQADFFNDQHAYIYFRSGAAAGEEGKVSDWVLGSTYTFTYAPASSAAPGTGALYSVHMEFRRFKIKEAINTAIDMAAKSALFFHRDESTIQLQTGLYSYPVPEGFTHIHKLTMADSDGRFQDESPIPPGQYRIVKGTEPRILFQTFPEDARFEGHTYGNFWRENDLSDGRYLRVEGLIRQGKLESDQDICRINPAFIIYQAAALLFQGMPEYADRYVAAQDRADKELTIVSSTRLHQPPDSKKEVE